MDQAESVDLLDPEGKLAALFHEPEPKPVPPNIHSVRVAALPDAVDMEDVERLAFPTLFPPTRFGREVSKTNTLYLVAMRSWTDDEIALGPDTSRPRRGSRGLFGMLAAPLKIPGKLLFQTIGGRRAKLSPQYLAGMVGLWFVMGEAHVVIIGNRPGDRRKGIGELLLVAAIEASIARGARVVTLEVRGSNQVARALYQKYSFREVGVRKRYYADNNEDAVIMTTPPIQGDEYREHFLKQVGEHELKWGESERRIS